MSETISRNCPLCGGNSVQVTEFGDDRWPVSRCRTCGFVYLESVPDYGRFIDEFAWEKTSSAETQRKIEREPFRQAVSRLLKRIRYSILKRDKLPKLLKHYVAPGKVLDVGCGTGGFLASMEPGYIPHGIEISRVLAATAQEKVESRGGYVVHDNAVSGLGKFPEDYFSGVVLSAFLEHEINPVDLLKGVRRALKPGGRCIVKVPNFASLNRVLRGKRWCGFRLPDHVNYFTPGTLVRTSEKAGLRIAKFSLADRLPTSDNMWIVLEKPDH